MRVRAEIPRTGRVASRPVGDPLYILAFDHRNSLMTRFFDVDGDPPPEIVERAREAKRLIWGGMRRALEEGAPQGSAGVLVDTTYGSDVIREAREAGVAVAVPVEASGRAEVAFEVPDWRERLDELDPTWAKVLVRYNPEGDEALNERQLATLRELAEHCRETDRPLMVELLVPPEPHQLQGLSRDRAHYDAELRPALMARAITELRASPIVPDVWKIEGLDDPADAAAIAAVAAAPCIVLGRGADTEAVDRWLRAGAAAPGYAGFAIGRSIWWGAMRLFFDERLAEDAREAATERIATNYRRCIDVYESAGATAGGSAS
jgi:myo-inositol catabolism protein IolC